MAFVALYGNVEACKAAGEWDCTHRRFEQTIADLLPNGAAWPRDDEALQELVASEATELSRVDLRAQKLLRELNPATTFELLTDWETMLGLPDCELPPTIEARRKAILAKLLAQTGHDQSLGYWTELVAQLGYVLEWVEQGHEVTTCADDCLDPLWTDEWEFVWSLAVDDQDSVTDALLECVVEHNALIETLALVHYLWTDVGLTPPGVLKAIASTELGYTVAVGLSALCLRAGADLTTWTPITLPIIDDYVCAATGDSNLVVIAGPTTTILRSTDGGENWSGADAAAVTGEVYGISRGPLDDDVFVAVGELGRVYRSTDAGQVWALAATPAAVSLRAVTRCTGALVAVGDDGAVFRSTTNGVSWDDQTPGGDITMDLLGVAGWTSTVIAVGAGGAIARSTDAGISWERVDSPTTANLRAVTSSPSGRWTVAGDGGVIVQSFDAGATWELADSPTTSDLFAAAAAVPGGRALVGGDDKTIVLE